MHEAGLVADNFGKFGQEGDDVVVGFPFDFVDPVDPGLGIGLVAAFANGAGGLGWNDSQVGLSVTGVGLDFKPDAKFVGGFPDGDHLGAAVARNHCRLRSKKVFSEAGITKLQSNLKRRVAQVCGWAKAWRPLR